LAGGGADEDDADAAAAAVDEAATPHSPTPAVAAEAAVLPEAAASVAGLEKAPARATRDPRDEPSPPPPPATPLEDTEAPAAPAIKDALKPRVELAADADEEPAKEPAPYPPLALPEAPAPNDDPPPPLPPFVAALPPTPPLPPTADRADVESTLAAVAASCWAPPTWRGMAVTGRWRLHALRACSAVSGESEPRTDAADPVSGPRAIGGGAGGMISRPLASTTGATRYQGTAVREAAAEEPVAEPVEPVEPPPPPPLPAPDGAGPSAGRSPAAPPPNIRCMVAVGR
jgi:hypothetical protein